jgi:hypothetical protein
LQPIEGRPIARNPLLLAELYFSGLDKEKWKNQKEAVAALAHLKPSVSRQDLSRAVGVSKLPPSVLSLFETAGVWSSTARELVSLAKKHGPPVLEERARGIDSRGLTWHQIVNLLDGKEPVAPKRRLRTTSPLVLAAMYNKGAAEGRWDSMTAAAEVLGWHKADLMRAIAISQLPAEVLQIFEGKTLVYAHGDVLLKIHEALGTAEMVNRAKELLNEPKRRTAEQIVAHLASVKEESGLRLRVRKDRSHRVTRLVFEFSVEAAQADEIITAGQDLAPIIQMVLSMLRTRKVRCSS